MTQPPFGYSSEFDVANVGSLTSAGVSAAQATRGESMTFQVTVADIGTNVVVRFEGSLDGTSYFNLNAASADFTITTNGTTGYFLVAPVKFVRFRLVSLSGGTPTVSCLIGTI
jgi:hypothetical protein